MESQKKETPLRQQDEPQTTDHEHILSPQKTTVNPDASTWLADMRREKNLRGNEVTAVIKSHRGKFDQSLLSKVERPGEYGVQLVPSVAKIVQVAFSYEPRRATKSDKRVKSCRLSGRLLPALYARLQTAMAANGINHNQDWIELMAERYADAYERSIR